MRNWKINALHTVCANESLFDPPEPTEFDMPEGHCSSCGADDPAECGVWQCDYCGGHCHTPSRCDEANYCSRACFRAYQED
jgi:hypothetical protein